MEQNTICPMIINKHKIGQLRSGHNQGIYRGAVHGGRGSGIWRGCFGLSRQATELQLLSTTGGLRYVCARFVRGNVCIYSHIDSIGGIPVLY